MLTASVFLVVQQFSGDASGNLRGDVSLYASEADAQAASGSGHHAPEAELGRINFSTVLVSGQDPLETITKALIAKFPAGAIVTV